MPRSAPTRATSSLKFRVARDRRGAFAGKIGATKTPEAFVIDSGGKVRYHGRIDDQFVARRRPQRHARRPAS